MFEARLDRGVTFKHIVDAIKDLASDFNLECTEDEISVQCMDSAHVSLVAMTLNSSAFSHYRCDRSLTLGVNSENLSKILKMMGKDDQLILKAEDDGDNLNLMFENPKTDSIADFGACVLLCVAATELTELIYLFDCNIVCFFIINFLIHCASLSTIN